MSYILDALRRADAERERGAVPGLHADTSAADPLPATRDRRTIAWLAGGGALLVVAAALAILLRSGSGRHDEAREAVPPVAVASPVPELSPAPTTQADAAELAQRTARAQGYAQRMAETAPVARRTATLPPPARPPAQDAAVAPAAAPIEHYGPPVTLPPGAAPARAPAPAPAPPAATANTQPAPDAPATGAVKKLEELPPSLRSTLPRLTVGGAIYSETPSARMLILNGQVYHEGDHPTPETRLEQIRLKSAVMSFRGTRYEISY